MQGQAASAARCRVAWRGARAADPTCGPVPLRPTWQPRRRRAPPLAPSGATRRLQAPAGRCDPWGLSLTAGVVSSPLLSYRATTRTDPQTRRTCTPLSRSQLRPSASTRPRAPPRRRPSPVAARWVRSLAARGGRSFAGRTTWLLASNAPTSVGRARRTRARVAAVRRRRAAAARADPRPPVAESAVVLHVAAAAPAHRRVAVRGSLPDAVWARDARGQNGSHQHRA